MGSLIGHRIDYNGVAALRGQQHILSKTLTREPHPPPPPLGEQEPSDDLFQCFQNFTCHNIYYVRLL